MTAYNRERYIAEAIESVLASTYSNFELIIVDDVSSDSTVHIIGNFKKKDSRISFYINEKNLGDYQNRNRAAHYATGEFIMYVDSDDMLLANTVQSAVSAMQQNPQAKYGLYTALPVNAPTYMKSNIAIRNHFFREPFLMYGPVATIVRTDFFRSIKGFPEKYGPANDMYYHLKAVSQTDILVLPFEFVYYRRHEGQEINNKYSYLYNNYLYLRDALGELDLPLTNAEKEWIQKKNKRRFIVNLARYLIKTGKLKNSYQAIKKTHFGIKDLWSAIFQARKKIF